MWIATSRMAIPQIWYAFPTTRRLMHGPFKRQSSIASHFVIRVSAKTHSAILTGCNGFISGSSDNRSSRAASLLWYRVRPLRGILRS